MNVENLRMLRDMMMQVRDKTLVAEGDPRLTEFDINHWHCGSTACVLGWAACHKPFMDMGMRVQDGFVRLGSYYGFQAAEELFDIPYTVAEDLFDPESYSYHDEKNPQAVIDKLNKLLGEATHES